MDESKSAPWWRLSFLGWCLLLSTIANLGTMGTLMYFAFEVRLFHGQVVVTGDVYVDGDVSVKNGNEPFVVRGER
jgi:hypothetical protein